MDRDNNGIPDWMEDENYADERPGFREGNVGSGCGGMVLPLLLGAGALAWGALQRRGRP
jgi:hypothetical protein